MARGLRVNAGGYVYHALNRANARMRIFSTDGDGDYAAFENVLAQACERMRMRLLSYCLMPNHWHLVLRKIGFSGPPGDPFREPPIKRMNP